MRKFRTVIALILVAANIFGIAACTSGTGKETQGLPGSESEKLTESERETESEKLTENETEAEADTEKVSDTETEKVTEKETEKETEKDTEKITEKVTETERVTEKDTEKISESEKVTEKETETEKATEKETETEPEPEKDPFVYTASDYLKTYSDLEAMNKWLKENIEDTDVPPVYFKLGGTEISNLKWVKKVGDPVTVTDYAQSDKPVKRTYREIEYVCAAKSLKIVLTLTSYPDYPVVEYSARLINTSSGKSAAINNLNAISRPICDYSGKIDFHYNKGGLYDSSAYEPNVKSITDRSSLTLETVNGLPSDSYMPYFNIEDKKNKDGVIAVLNWQGGWKMKAEVSGGKVKMTAGQSVTSFNMLGKEELKLPGMVLLFYKNGDWQYGQNVWRRWLIDHNLMRETGRRDFKENVFLCSPLSGTADDTGAIKAVAKTNIPKKFNCVFELDAGWYETYGRDWTYTGFWTPAEKYADGGLKTISDLCHKNGISFCMWMEPERIFFGTKQSDDLGNDNMIYVRPDLSYISYSDCKRTGYDPTGSCLINYGKREAIDYAVALVDGAVKEYGMDVYRQDFNTYNMYYWNAYDNYEAVLYSAQRKGVTELKACEGYIDVWTEIENRNPGLIFDACAGGGRRLDLETLRFSFAHTKTDYWDDVVSQQCQNYGAYSWLIFTGTGFTDMTSNYDIRTRLSLSIGVGCTAATDYALMEKALDEWQSLHKYMYNDFWQIGSFDNSKNGKLAMQFSDHEKGEGMLIAYLRNGGVYDLKAKDLVPDCNYRVWDGDNKNSVRVMSGKKLMEEGFTVAYQDGIPVAVVVWYEPTDEEITPFNRKEFLEGSNSIDYSKLKKQTNDEKALVKLHKESGVTGNGVVYLCADYESSGGIYAISNSFYSKIATLNKTNSDGWKWVDPEKMKIGISGNSYPLTQWAVGGAFDIRAYIKQIDGCCFLWIDNSFGFGDPDGGWSTSDRIIILSNVGIESNSFKFQVCRYDTLGGRDLQFIFDDKEGGSVYYVSEELYKKLELSSNTHTEHGYTWTEINYANMYFRMAKNRNIQNVDDDTLYNTISLWSLSRQYGVRIYLTEKNGKYYIWIKDAENMINMTGSDRCEWYYVWDNTLCHTTFYNVIPGFESQNIAKVSNITKLW